MLLRTVLRNERRLLAADPALRIALVVFAVLFVYALANGMVWDRFQARTVEAARTGNAERVRALEQELTDIANGGPAVLALPRPARARTSWAAPAAPTPPRWSRARSPPWRSARATSCRTTTTSASTPTNRPSSRTARSRTP